MVRLEAANVIRVQLVPILSSREHRIQKIWESRMALLNHPLQFNAQFDLLLKQCRHVPQVLRIDKPPLKVVVCDEHSTVIGIASEYAADRLNDPSRDVRSSQPFNPERLVNEPVD